MPRLDGKVNLQGRWHLYPDRQRCLACRRFFGFTVIDRLYCSYLRAGVKPPGDDPNEAPRKKNTDAYYCDYCHHYHIGHIRVRELV
jgi:hypothetical protein